MSTLPEKQTSTFGNRQNSRALTPREFRVNHQSRRRVAKKEHRRQRRKICAQKRHLEAPTQAVLVENEREIEAADLELAIQRILWSDRERAFGRSRSRRQVSGADLSDLCLPRNPNPNVSFALGPLVSRLQVEALLSFDSDFFMNTSSLKDAHSLPGAQFPIPEASSANSVILSQCVTNRIREDSPIVPASTGSIGNTATMSSTTSERASTRIPSLLSLQLEPPSRLRTPGRVPSLLDLDLGNVNILAHVQSSLLTENSVGSTSSEGHSHAQGEPLIMGNDEDTTHSLSSDAVEQAEDANRARARLHTEMFRAGELDRLRHELLASRIRKRKYPELVDEVEQRAEAKKSSN